MEEKEQYCWISLHDVWLSIYMYVDVKYDLHISCGWWQADEVMHDVRTSISTAWIHLMMKVYNIR